MKNEKNKSEEIEEKIEKIEILLNEIKELKQKDTEEKAEENKEKITEEKAETKIDEDKEDEIEIIEETEIIKSTFKNPWFYFSVIVVIIILLLIYKFFFFSPINNIGIIKGVNNISTENIKVSADDDAVLGNENATVTIIEFSDYECPFCGRYFKQTYPQIVKEYVNTGKVKIVFRDFPLEFHQNAQKAAEASEVAHELGGNDAFWKMHDKIFENQQAISEQNLVKYAKEIGLDENKFKEILISGKYKNEIQKDIEDGQKAGVQGTPTFFINGRILIGAQSFSEFKKIIDEELQ